jgi:hypothetical protein
MPTRDQVFVFCQSMGLTAYQTDTIVNNRMKYHVHKMVKHNGIVWIPYRTAPRDFREGALRVLFGPRADLLGADRVLSVGRRGFKKHRDGFILVHSQGTYYFNNAFAR